MKHPEVVQRLDAFVDGALSSEETRRCQEHLATCAECREELSRLGALLDQASGLRVRAADPARDLWPEILRRIEGSAVARPAARGAIDTSRRRSVRGIVLWAAPACLALAVAVFLLWRPAGRIDLERRVAGLAAVETDASRARSDYETLLARPGERLPAGARGEFEKNLRLLDQAIHDSRRALDSHPRDQGLQRSLLAIYQQQIDLLRWATRLTRQS